MDDEDLPPIEAEAGEEDAPIEEVVTETAAVPSVEDLAGEMGWRPQDQWKGDPAKWKPAHDFMRSTIDVNRNLSNKLKTIEEQSAITARTTSTLIERAREQERAQLLAARDRAFDEGDRETFAKVDADLKTLQEPVKAEPLPEAREFEERNPWYGKDDDATRWAYNRAEQLSQQGISPARQLSIVEREAKGLFPELFSEPAARPRPAPLNQPGNRGAAPAKRGFSALPADAQKAALAFEKSKTCTREEYAKEYFSEKDA